MKFAPNIHRLSTVYQDIFTTVYALRTPSGDILFDAASYPEDIDGSVVPFLTQAGITPDTLKYVFISHNHSDHSGGLARLLEKYPDITIVTCSATLKEKYAHRAFVAPKDGDMLLDVYRVVTVPGHTADSAALLDTRDGTLITGDCLQQQGIRGSGNWACNISLPRAHLDAIEKIRGLQPQRIYTAHDYVPCGWMAENSSAVNRLLDACIEPLYRLARLIRENPELDDSQIRNLFSDFEGKLTVKVPVVTAMRSALEAGEL